MNTQILLRIGDNLNSEDIGKQLNSEGLEVAYQNLGQNMDVLATTLIVTGANVLIAVLNVVFSYLQARRAGKIVVQGIDGWRVELPSDMAQQELKTLIDLASTKNVHQITITDTMPNKKIQVTPKSGAPD